MTTANKIAGKPREEQDQPIKVGGIWHLHQSTQRPGKELLDGYLLLSNVDFRVERFRLWFIQPHYSIKRSLLPLASALVLCLVRSHFG